jgi:hypothetical protein
VIAGAYVSLAAAIPKQAVEPYFFWRQSRNVTAELGGVAALHQATSGVRMAGKVPWALDYSAELAVQTGSVGPDDVMAWASHGVVGKTGKTIGGTPTRVFGEYNYASGDTDRVDGLRGTLISSIRPTRQIGLSDQVGWRNIRRSRGREIKPRQSGASPAAILLVAGKRNGRSHSASRRSWRVRRLARPAATLPE